MQLNIDRLEVEIDGVRAAVALPDARLVEVGPLRIDIGGSAFDHVTWTVANRGDHPVRVRFVRVVYRRSNTGGPLRMLRQGYQSWTRTAVATLGVDRDPSTTPGSMEMMQGIHHADQRRADDGELRSEWVTVLADDDGELRPRRVRRRNRARRHVAIATARSR